MNSVNMERLIRRLKVTITSIISNAAKLVLNVKLEERTDGIAVCGHALHFTGALHYNILFICYDYSFIPHGISLDSTC